ncbi:MAG TPA: sigma-54 dependent transcriptional regulator [Polyangiaceae bacterium LLY-WYZ-15_(1-7)]|nr:Fis family transcriptional regulator [Myxococcales bacterium]MAT27685.1 Fis family transcriptional regulator [Sandaracinus sp.]HJK93910.1 sigma-54 dependent transcriptional regulator [Polyangiaceae bacterium LLY-WYZ-15_(1-7)]HJL06590.1 sigma-54 dependent transcriptional regulator [Polyangiaceae bacterium LLY-WYZ-15_(1-7)]HJL10150.1 sigma-54 dependent transcriptional regulator [Polyangiaceae bacterium LLY-WYZ-15_(1-7)]
MTATILVVDDEKNIRRTLRMVLEGAGFDVEDAESAEEGLKRLDGDGIDLVILDVRLPEMSGLEALEQIRQRPESRNLPVLMISGHASVAEAVSAVQTGATDFFEKPLDRDRVLVSVRNALQTWQLQREVERLRADAESRYEMIGESPAMRALYAQLEKVAPTNGRVLITGESGTGKELIARAVHRLSQRKDGPFIKVNCAAIPAELIESELFGYERGAFTGAQGRRKGMFEQADGGTLFLDEIGDMSGNAQAKVLRALQSGEISRVGSEKAIAVDVRVLAATNKDLELEVKEGRFREDLYFRLNVVPLKTPPLRDRPQDVPLLVKAFLRDFARENGLREKPIEAEVLEALAQRSWPGNVRELKNVVERMAILSGETIGMHDLPDEGRLGQAVAQEAATPAPGLPSTVLPEGERMTLREYREHAEKQYILAMLDETGWNISRAAVKLGVERTNLHKKMRTYGIKRETHQNR